MKELKDSAKGSKSVECTTTGQCCHCQFVTQIIDNIRVRKTNVFENSLKIPCRSQWSRNEQTERDDEFD